MGTTTRNPVYRMWVQDESCPIIVKWFLPEFDPFYRNRYRREEKILWLLNQWFSNRVPELYGGAVTNDFAVLIEQDVGTKSLDCMLNTITDKTHKFDISSQGVEFLADFHRVCQKHYTVFYRVCYSTNLDRLTLKTYLRRAKIAIGRLLLLNKVLEKKFTANQAIKVNIAQLETIAIDELGDKFFEWYTANVIAPLIRTPRQIVHNSFSPFHLIWSDHWSLIDFETMSVGATQIDLAEFVGSPKLTLSNEYQYLLIEKYYKLRDYSHQSLWSEFLKNYYNALATRSLDYLGTTAFLGVRYISQQQDDKVRLNLERARQYRSRMIEALKNNYGNNLPSDIPHV
ncbi:phosphotransferase [Anaerolineales bacterium HSG24]|nr:phosphotransferase [Anaerolineales bacterium HSG24]